MPIIFRRGLIKPVPRAGHFRSYVLNVVGSPGSTWPV